MRTNTITEQISKPYPNYHAARVKGPGLFLRVRVLQTTKSGVMIYGGPLKTDPKGPAKTQALRFPKEKFTVVQAKAWLKEHKQEYNLFEPATSKAKRLWPTMSKREIYND